MILFLDTEWADLECTHLISIGLVGADVRYRFYSERKVLPQRPTKFVEDVVYPLLDRGTSALDDLSISRGLRRFVARVAKATGETPTIACDFWADRALFVEAWMGMGAAPSRIRPPDLNWLDLRKLGPAYVEGREAYFAANLEAQLRRHHALVDAFAARAGYVFATQGGSGG